MALTVCSVQTQLLLCQHANFFYKAKNKQKSFVNTNIKIEYGPIGWGFFASKDIPAGEQLIRVERRDQITIANVTDTLQHEALNWEAKVEGQDGDDVTDEGPDCVDGLTMFLLLEKFQRVLPYSSFYFSKFLLIFYILALKEKCQKVFSFQNMC